jgi:signal transduction histidine kinase
VSPCGPAVARRSLADLDSTDQTRVEAVILVVEDGGAIGAVVRDALGDRYRIEIVEGSRLDPSAELRADLFVCAAAFLEALRPLAGGGPIVVVTSETDIGVRDRLFADGASDLLLQPLCMRELQRRIETTLRAAKQVATDADRRRLARQLEAASAELHRFTYAVSHDLRAPVRAIDGFSAMFLADHGDGLSPEARADLEHVRTGARRLAMLIDSLSVLSRVGLMEVSCAPLDLTALAGAVVDELRARDGTRDVVVTIAPGLRADADARLVRTVLERLLDNAWKFTSRRDRASIEIGTELFEGQPVFFVRDDGVGFDPQFAARLFAPFQRLHGAEFDGVGVGLATVQRIVGRHGGRVWADGAPGAGAVVRFTLCDDRKAPGPRRS